MEIVKANWRDYKYAILQQIQRETTLNKSTNKMAIQTNTIHTTLFVI